MNWTKALKYLAPWIKAQEKIHAIEQAKYTQEILDREKEESREFFEYARALGVMPTSDSETYIRGVAKLYDEFCFSNIASIQSALRQMRQSADILKLDLYDEVIRRNLAKMQ